MIKTIDVADLKPEQIEQLQAIIEAFKAKNKLENTVIYQDKFKDINDINMNDIFFESEIIQPFNRSMLYGKRA